VQDRDGETTQLFHAQQRLAWPMSSRFDPLVGRRRLFQFLAGSPLLGGARAFAQATSPSLRVPDPMVWAPRDLSDLISDPGEALDVFDFEPVAKKNLPPAHFGYMVTGSDDEVTLRANREGFLKFQLRPRRLVDVSAIDMTTELMGAKYDSPIVIAPTGSNRAFHPDGEVAVARAAKAGDHLQILSSGATTAIEEAIAARGAPVWFQVYPRKWEVTHALVRRAERAGAPVVVLTIDGVSATNWETLLRLRRKDERQCDGCHGTVAHDYAARKPNFAGIDLSDPASLNAASLTWEWIARLRDTVKTKIVLKGILTREDAELAADYGVDGIIVSNHGGRVVESGRATIEVLPEIIETVGDSMTVMVDSGFRRGTDIVKALAMGAHAVCVGRPYLWGLAAFGQPGVERVLEILRKETRAAMQQLGAPSIKHLTRAMVQRA
jgi:isopentenyl diphosphate isomerase/L-lactate dehydrogenase-like FMN-dependent dehydrogenase